MGEKETIGTIMGDNPDIMGDNPDIGVLPQHFVQESEGYCRANHTKYRGRINWQLQLGLGTYLR